MNKFGILQPSTLVTVDCLALGGGAPCSASKKTEVLLLLDNEVDVPLNYADHCFPEALLRYRNLPGNDK
jgi:hypothetical protein